MSYNHRKCEDEEDAARMAENILRLLGYTNVQRGKNDHDVQYQISDKERNDIAKNAERISRWARYGERT